MPTKKGSALTQPAPEAEAVPVPVDLSTLKVVSIEDILGSDDLPTREVAVPEWGGKVVIRGFTKQVEMDIREEAGGQENFDKQRFELLLFVYGVVEPQFSVAHVELLKEKNAAPFDRVLEDIMDLAGLTKGAKAKAKAAFPEGQRETVHVHPSEGPEDDGAPAQSGDGDGGVD